MLYKDHQSCQQILLRPPQGYWGVGINRYAVCIVRPIHVPSLKVADSYHTLCMNIILQRDHHQPMAWWSSRRRQSCPLLVIEWITPPGSHKISRGHNLFVLWPIDGRIVYICQPTGCVISLHYSFSPICTTAPYILLWSDPES